MSDNPSPIPIPDDIVVIPNPATNEPEAVNRVQWDGERGMYRVQTCLKIADAAQARLMIGKSLMCALVPLEADGTLSPEKCREALVVIGARRAAS